MIQILYLKMIRLGWTISLAKETLKYTRSSFPETFIPQCPQVLPTSCRVNPTSRTDSQGPHPGVLFLIAEVLTPCSGLAPKPFIKLSLPFILHGFPIRRIILHYALILQLGNGAGVTHTTRSPLELYVYTHFDICDEGHLYI